MSNAATQDWWISPEEYLAGEERAETKSEYVGGVVHAMAGGRVNHNRIATNVLIELGSQLRGKKCQPFNSDMMLRIRYLDHTRFYYPDVMVVCESNAADEVFQDQPVVLFEVASDSTSRTDRDEKLRAYQTIPSLQAYLLLESHRTIVTVHRRTEQGWETEFFTRRAETIELPGLGCALSVAALYDGTGL